MPNSITRSILIASLLCTSLVQGMNSDRLLFDLKIVNPESKTSEQIFFLLTPQYSSVNPMTVIKAIEQGNLQKTESLLQHYPHPLSKATDDNLKLLNQYFIIASNKFNEWPLGVEFVNLFARHGFSFNDIKNTGTIGSFKPSLFAACVVNLFMNPPLNNGQREAKFAFVDSLMKHGANPQLPTCQTKNGIAELPLVECLHIMHELKHRGAPLSSHQQRLINLINAHSKKQAGDYLGAFLEDIKQGKKIEIIPQALELLNHQDTLHANKRQEELLKKEADMLFEQLHNDLLLHDGYMSPTNLEATCRLKEVMLELAKLNN